MTFNKKFLLAGAALSGVILAGAFFAGPAQAVTDQLDLEARVVEAITVNCTTALDFGNLDSTAAAVITMSTAGARSSTVPAALIPGGSPSAGVCGIDGEDGLVVDVAIADDSITNGTDTLTVDNYTFAGTGAATTDPNNHEVTLQAGGSQDYNIGGDLTLTIGASAGLYTGTVDVVVTYQ